MSIFHQLTYWHQSLIDSERMSLDYEKVKGRQKVHASQVEAGAIGWQETKALFDLAGEQDKNKKKGAKRPKHEQDIPAEIDVLICPLVAFPQTQSNKDQKPITPLWIPAKLAQGGDLSMSELTSWIPRTILDPVESEKSMVVIGTTEDEQAFLRSHTFPEETDWQSYWRYCNEMFQAVTGYPIKGFRLEGYNVRGNTAYVLPSDLVVGSILHILPLYEHLIENRITPPLLKQYATFEPPPLRPLMTPTTPDWRTISYHHLGQMGGKFPLSTSQRETLFHYLTIQDGDILAVNGPPGTGKTTMLQSVIASLWVDAAVRRSEPPVIVATSANNQAVTNIISSFGKVGVSQELDGKAPEGRWLPEICSYGLYCLRSTVSDSEADEIRREGWQTVQPGQPGFLGELETPDYITQATTTFLQKCQGYFKRPFSGVAEAQNVMHQALIQAVNDIRLIELTSEYNQLDQQYGGAQGLESAIGGQSGDLAQTRQTLAAIRQYLKNWRKTVTQRPAWMTLLSFFGPVKKQIAQLNKQYFETHRLPVSPTHFHDDSVEGFFNERIRAKEQEEQGQQQRLHQLQADQQRISELGEALSAWYARYDVRNAPADLDDLVDVTARFEAFKLATHYWEASWLLEVSERKLAAADDWSKEAVEKRWRRYAKLTPCLVSTLYMLPRHFNASYKPLLEYIDLLIIDEAGQASPELGAAIFALAKRALVVGDVYQLEPVVHTKEPVDNANLIRFGLAQKGDESGLVQVRSQISPMQSSVMKIAQNSSYYGTGDERGMLLKEHYRCAAPIIKYCNDLVYKGRLVPSRPAKDIKKPDFLPYLGYANIPGAAERVNGSWRNRVEARTIRRWLADKRAALEEAYGGKPLKEIVGIVTPFLPQKFAILGEFNDPEVGGALNGITVGTVHALQGAERDLVIFSPVYSELPDSGWMFFDLSVNMLNVAVSRAKDSFLVFGNMAIFNQQGSRPSSLLARMLFNDEQNELTEVYKYPMRKFYFPDATVRHITKLDDHRAILRECIETAQRWIAIASPQLSMYAVKADQVVGLIQKACQRGVEVVVYTDHELNMKEGAEKHAAKQAREALMQAGADVRILDHTHNKTICKDDNLLIEGSFNWLSAVREPNRTGTIRPRYEASMRYSGNGVKDMINTAIAELEKRRVSPTGRR